MTRTSRPALAVLALACIALVLAACGQQTTGPSAAAAPAAPAKTAAQLETEAWEAVEQSGTAESVEKFRTDYPTSTQVEQAQQLRDQLRWRSAW